MRHDTENDGPTDAEATRRMALLTTEWASLLAERATLAAALHAAPVPRANALVDRLIGDRPKTLLAICASSVPIGLFFLFVDPVWRLGCLVIASLGVWTTLVAWRTHAKLRRLVRHGRAVTPRLVPTGEREVHERTCGAGSETVLGYAVELPDGVTAGTVYWSDRRGEPPDVVTAFVLDDRCLTVMPDGRVEVLARARKLPVARLLASPSRPDH